MDTMQGRSGRAPLLHPLSGALILGLDWVLFSGNVALGGIAAPALMGAGFVLGSIGTACVQRFVAQDTRLNSALKGFGAGLVVGAPLPVAGTVVGGAVLTLSGLTSLKRRLLSGRS